MALPPFLAASWLPRRDRILFILGGSNTGAREPRLSIGDANHVKSENANCDRDDCSMVKIDYKASSPAAQPVGLRWEGVNRPYWHLTAFQKRLADAD